MLGRNYRHVVALLCLATATVASAQTMPDTVAAAFARMQHLCRSDGGKTWGVELCGPVLFADPATRRFWADHDGLQQALTQHGDIFTGQLPATVPIANTAVEWNGRSWTMLMLPLPEQEPALSILLMHEAWHRIQQQIGLAAGNAEQPQLETEAGRLALRLELRALASAFAASDAPARRQAIADALLFRAWRQQRWPDAEAAEDTMERHEGLAEYTGRLLAQDPAMIAHLRQHLGRGDAVDAYARSFAYYTGPAYAFLLDAAQPRWRADWNRRDGLPAMLARQLALVTVADDAAFAARGAHYRLGGGQAEERQRAQQHAVRVAALRARLIDGPTLQVPVRGASFSFDPNRVTLLPQGTVYALIRAAGEWGVLEVDGDGLLAMDWSRLSVSHAGVTATADGFKGEGWTLVLQPGWALVAGARAGDWTIRRAD